MIVNVKQFTVCSNGTLVAEASELQLRGRVPVNLVVRDFPSEGVNTMFEGYAQDRSPDGEVAGWKYKAGVSDCSMTSHELLIIND